MRTAESRVKQSASSVTGDACCECLSVRGLTVGGRSVTTLGLRVDRQSAGVPDVVRPGDEWRGVRVTDDDPRAVYFRA